MDKSGKVIAIISGVVVVLCACLVIAAAGGVVIYEYVRATVPTLAEGPFDLTPGFPPGDPTDAPTPPFEMTRPPVDEVPTDTLRLLEQTNVPENDPYELACRLQGVCDVPRSFEGPPAPLQVGTQDTFWLLNTDTNTHFEIGATLQYVTEHTYFWVEDGIRFDKEDMKALMDTFEREIYPTNRAFFGSEWTPGVDGDPHIYVIYADDIGGNVAGYFSSSDSYNPLAKEYSNAHETYVISATQDLGAAYTYSTLAHEFVHMIQFNSDRNDETWMTEGFAEVGSFINGYDVGGWDWAYADEPDLQLTDWSPIPGTNGPHYGQSFLFLAYFLDRFGEEATKALTNNPDNGLSSIDGTLADLGITDNLTGEIITADDVFMDWGVAMYLNDRTVGDGRYTYYNYPGAPQASRTYSVSFCPTEPVRDTVNQYGLDYIKITCPGEHTLRFEGSTLASLLPEDPYSGSYAFWSNKGDESDMTLTREFDFTGVSGPIEFSFRTWYDLEEDYDYLYLELSEDGELWQILTTPSGTPEDPSGNSYGWGYNGQTRGWIEESIDLSEYAGQKIWLRFEYVTDAAVNGEGMLIDDVSIEAIDYFADFEADDGGWVAEGFVRIQNVLPQTFRLALIKEGSTTTVEMIDLNDDQTVEIPISIGGDVDSVTVMVSGMTRFTRAVGSYKLEVR